MTPAIRAEETSKKCEDLTPEQALMFYSKCCNAPVHLQFPAICDACSKGCYVIPVDVEMGEEK